MVRLMCVLGFLSLTGVAQSNDYVFVDHLEPDGSSVQLALHHTKGEGSPVLYIHGSSFPSALSIAWKFADGISWADNLAAKGLDVWSLDFLGYGHSSRPDYSKVFDNYARSGHAAEQIATVVSFISAQHDGAKVSIIAHSWGTIAAGRFTALSPDKVDRVIFFGPIVPRKAEGGKMAEAVQKFNLVTTDAQRRRFLSEVPNAHAPVLEEPDLKRWGQAYLDSDPESQTRSPASVKVPSGPIRDALKTWNGNWLYKPENIKQPILIIRGEWDTASTSADADYLLSKLGSRDKHIITVPAATHLMHLETGRFGLWRVSAEFLKAGAH